MQRAEGITLSLPEKQLYKGVCDYLDKHLEKTDRIAVAGYKGCYSQFSYLSGYDNCFADEEFLFRKLKFLVEVYEKKEGVWPVLKAMESKVISRLKQEQPEMMLMVIEEPLEGLTDFKFLSPGAAEYIKNNYSQEATFGPADVHGLGGRQGWVRLYRKNKIRSL